jgi:cytochrome b involved in lipid metabolism
MKNRLTSIIIGLVLVVGTGSLVYFTKKPIVVPPEVSNSTQNTPVKVTESDDDDEGNITPAPTPSGIAPTQIVQHSSRSNCWSAINGSVYDLTSWIPNHPGGEEKILSLCGIDGSSRYNSKHGGEAKPARMLAGFKLGILAQ